MLKRRLIPFLVILAALWGLWVHSLPHRSEPIYAGPGVVRIDWLSRYNPRLSGSVGDTEIYVLEGAEEGGTAVVLGGSHANEISSVLAAILLVENVELQQGRLLVIPHANASAIRYHRPLRGEPYRVQIPLEDGGYRYFRYGSRYTHPLHQWPDPVLYHHPMAQNPIAGTEHRNLNRVHPGEGDSLTEEISRGIVNLLLQEEADLVLDFHEAPPQSSLANNIVVHPKGLELGAEVVLNLQFIQLPFHLETSSGDFRGLSHRELGDFTPAIAVLTETANPYQGSYFVATSYQVILSGEEEGYRRYQEERPFLHADFSDLPLVRRVGRQLAVLKEFLAVYSWYHEERGFKSTIPSYEQVVEGGLSAFLAGQRGGNDR